MKPLLADIRFAGPAIEWRGPAPFVFVALPEPLIGEIRWAAREASYGWGCVPAEIKLTQDWFNTSLFPREGGYMIPLKVAVRRAEGIALGDMLDVRLRVLGR